MAATYLPAKLLDRVAVVAGTIAGITGRVYEGKKVIPESTTHESDVKDLTAESQGYFSAYVASRMARGQIKMGEVRIAAMLEYNLPDETTTTHVTLIDLAESILAALMVESNFSSVVARPISGEFVLVNDGLDDGCAQVEYDLTYEVGLICEP